MAEWVSVEPNSTAMWLPVGSLADASLKKSSSTAKIVDGSKFGFVYPAGATGVADVTNAQKPSPPPEAGDLVENWSSIAERRPRVRRGPK